MKRLLFSAAALALLYGAPAPPPAAALGLCKIYCEAIYAGCQVTFGHIDSDWCEEWRQGCLDGCARK